MQATPSAELRILLVDDHEDTLAVLKRLLRLEGHTVKTTSTSRYALEIVRTEAFDILMSDIGLPDMDGRELLAAVRAIRPIKAIALTGYGMPDEVRQTREAGFDDVLIKPISLEALIGSVQQVAGDRPAAAATPAPAMLAMQLLNYEKTLEMLCTEVERRKMECQISQLRRRLADIGSE